MVRCINVKKMLGKKLVNDKLNVDLHIDKLGLKFAVQLKALVKLVKERRSKKFK